jgi:hypothetical protein
MRLTRKEKMLEGFDCEKSTEGEVYMEPSGSSLVRQEKRDELYMTREKDTQDGCWRWGVRVFEDEGNEGFYSRDWIKI